MISVSGSGNFKKTEQFLRRASNRSLYSDLDRYGKMGVDALSRATPTESGVTGKSWAYRIVRDSRRTGVEWYNTHVVGGTPLVILLQYGHATGTGGYVQGRDFINPAIAPIFDRIAIDFWKKVTS